MGKIKLCCFTVNTTHACIISNNFIKNNIRNMKVIYINEKGETKKLNNIISRFYKTTKGCIYYTDRFNETMLNDYNNEKFVFVIHGKEKFVDKTNDFLELNPFDGFIINCYDVYDIKENIEEIIKKHDHYINTTGIVEKIC